MLGLERECVCVCSHLQMDETVHLCLSQTHSSLLCTNDGQPGALGVAPAFSNAISSRSVTDVGPVTRLVVTMCNYTDASGISPLTCR